MANIEFTVFVSVVRGATLMLAPAVAYRRRFQLVLIKP
jgi:hypothetical protein